MGAAQEPSGSSRAGSTAFAGFNLVNLGFSAVGLRSLGVLGGQGPYKPYTLNPKRFRGLLLTVLMSGFGVIGEFGQKGRPAGTVQRDYKSILVFLLGIITEYFRNSHLGFWGLQSKVQGCLLTSCPVAS